MEQRSYFLQERFDTRVKTEKNLVPIIQQKELYLIAFQETNDKLIESQSDTEEKEYISDGKINKMDAIKKKPI